MLGRILSPCMWFSIQATRRCRAPFAQHPWLKRCDSLGSMAQLLQERFRQEQDSLEAKSCSIHPTYHSNRPCVGFQKLGTKCHTLTSFLFIEFAVSQSYARNVRNLLLVGASLSLLPLSSAEDDFRGEPYLPPKRAIGMNRSIHSFTWLERKEEEDG